jgi:2-oxo-4-hydroxy-4-carboxy-5-ureidoimidazoline decarboxylase
MTLADLNARDRQSFVDSIGWVFEHSPWVAERAWPCRPFASVEDLHQAMIKGVAGATVEEQLALLRAHPDLGARARLSEASTTEQARAGLDALTAVELDRLRRLNRAYREKFGFPFLYAVKGSTKHDILKALETRLGAPREDELNEALGQVYRIARFRLDDLFGGCS